MNPSSPHKVDLWFWRLAPGDDAEAVLAPDELARAKKRIDPGGREKDVAARSGLRMRLAMHAGLSPESLEFEVNDFGKPRLRQRPSLHFNLSHSGEMACLAVCDQAPVGVDIEQITAADLDVARSYFTEAEFSALAAAPADIQGEVFFRLWTLKEAVIKAIGAGLSAPLNAFEVSPHQPALAACPRDWGEPREWRLRLSSPSEGYLCALAVRTGGTDVQVVEHTS